MSRTYAILLSALLVAGTAGATTIFSTGFESGTPTQITGEGGIVSTSAVSGSNTIDANSVWQNADGGVPAAPATTLTLTGLNPNQNLDLDFTFLAIGSWDGLTNGGSAPDYMTVDLNSSSIFDSPFRNYGLASPEYPGCTVGSNCTPALYPAPPANTTITLEQGNTGDFGTSIYDISITGLTADSSGNATFTFFASGTGWQGGNDESVGLDNITVSSADAPAATPEPSTWALFGGALLCLPLLRRRVFVR